MARSKGITKNKSKSFTFRVTEELSKDVAEVKAKCKQIGLRWNVTEALTKALEDELKAVQKHIQKETQSNYNIGQGDLPIAPTSDSASE